MSLLIAAFGGLGLAFSRLGAARKTSTAASTPPTEFELREDGSFILREDGSRVGRESF